MGSYLLCRETVVRFIFCLERRSFYGTLKREFCFKDFKSSLHQTWGLNPQPRDRGVLAPLSHPGAPAGSDSRIPLREEGAGGGRGRGQGSLWCEKSGSLRLGSSGAAGDKGGGRQ